MVTDNHKDAFDLIQTLKEHKLTITTAESCTGGLIASKLVDISGASSVFSRGYITYSEEAKMEELGVLESSIKTYGVVSKEVASEMAIGVVRKANADVSVSITGIAGPDGGTKEKPVGLVYIACVVNGEDYVMKRIFQGSREEIRENAANEAISFTKDMLDKCI